MWKIDKERVAAEFLKSAITDIHNMNPSPSASGDLHLLADATARAIEVAIANPPEMWVKTPYGPTRIEMGESQFIDNASDTTECAKEDPDSEAGTETIRLTTEQIGLLYLTTDAKDPQQAVNDLISEAVDRQVRQVRLEKLERMAATTATVPSASPAESSDRVITTTGDPDEEATVTIGENPPMTVKIKDPKARRKTKKLSESLRQTDLRLESLWGRVQDFEHLSDANGDSDTMFIERIDDLDEHDTETRSRLDQIEADIRALREDTRKVFETVIGNK